MKDRLAFCIVLHHLTENTMSNFKGRKRAGESIEDAVRDTGTAVAEGFTDQLGLKQPMSLAELDEMTPGMEVVSLCGCRIGTVDHLEGNSIRLARSDSPDGRHHFIPVDWVARVDEHVHLNTDVFETKQGWGS